MPELPEIETYKTYFDSTSLHQKVTGFDCRDDRLLKAPENDFREYLVGEEFTGTTRIGKYLFVHTTGKKVLVLHFGMTGNLDYYKDPEDRPKYAHIEYAFASGFQLGFLNKRKFGWNDLADSVEEYKEKTGLSDDARDLSFEQFEESLSGRSAPVKSILLDQSVAAGIGNWMADEILYQARIHPETRVNDMTSSQLKEVFRAMKHLIEVSIEKQAVYDDFPDDFFIHIRKEGATCHHTGEKIRKTKVGGRSTYYCPEWQKSN